MEYTEFINPEFLTFVPALYLLGIFLKKTEKIKDKYIPLILSGISIVLCCSYSAAVDGLSVANMVTAFVQGIFCTATAVYTNQLIKQTSK